MAKVSAGLLLFRRREGAIEVFLVHPGGPFWAGKEAHAWSIPKGEVGPGEEPRAAALREFGEETGLSVAGELVALPPCKQAGGKIVQAWAVEADCDPAAVRSNLFAMEWPPRSGRKQEFPEIDRAAWFPVAEARAKIHKGQVALLEALAGIAV
ncbi:MAG TPA: NUDIX domain-containing protein [Candidatus Acidoferrum sp.]|nr:NUDIX domain-containing protein [Candidatus Acidoferrum sp.]